MTIHQAELCTDAECEICSIADCPHGEPLHYHHDGCPSCTEHEQKLKLNELDAEFPKLMEQFNEFEKEPGTVPQQMSLPIIELDNNKCNIFMEENKYWKL